MTFECPFHPIPFLIDGFDDNKGMWNWEVYSEVLGDFTMWMNKQFQGTMMVADLQGVETDKEFVLTDPAILFESKREDIERFGNTNFG